MGANDEQWHLDGDCSECRKGKYCRKPCGAKKVIRRAALGLAEELSAAMLNNPALALGELAALKAAMKIKAERRATNG